MSTDYSANLFYGVEIDSDIYEESECNEPMEVDIEYTGNAVCGDDFKAWATIQGRCTDCHGDMALEVNLIVDKEKEKKLIEYVKTLGVENPQPKWILGMYVG